MSKQSDGVQVIQKPQQQLSQGLAITQDVRLRVAQAEMFARYNLAIMVPRDWTVVEAKLLQDCDNPDFAKEAYFRKPAGRDFIEGLSVRFAERAQQHMRNISVDTSPEMEDEFSVHYRTTVVDLENNTPTSETFKVEKTVERKRVADGDTVLSQRTNSSGDPVYLVPATEDQLNTKLRAQAAKVKRTLLLALVPADTRSRCLERARSVATSQDSKDPSAATKSIVSAFISIGVDVADLKEYLGKAVQSATAPQIEELRSIYALIRDDELSWRDVMEAKREREAEKGSKAAFVAEKQKEREKRKADKNKGTQAPAGAAAPRARRGSVAAAAPAAADSAAAQDSDKPAAETKPETPARPRASRRGDDEEGSQQQGDGEQASNSTPA